MWLHALVLSLLCEMQAHLAGIKPLVSNYSDHDAGSCGLSILSDCLRIWVKTWVPESLNVYIGCMLVTWCAGWSTEWVNLFLRQKHTSIGGEIASQWIYAAAGRITMLSWVSWFCRLKLRRAWLLDEMGRTNLLSVQGRHYLQLFCSGGWCDSCRIWFVSVKMGQLDNTGMVLKWS